MQSAIYNFLPVIVLVITLAVGTYMHIHVGMCSSNDGFGFSARWDMPSCVIRGFSSNQPFEIQKREAKR